MGDRPVFRYGALEAPFDPMDYVQIETAEDALERMKGGIEAALLLERTSAQYRGMTLAVAQVFDDIFGDDAANKVLGGSTSFAEAMEALTAFTEHTRSTNEAFAERWKAVTSKYAPRGDTPNRATRRAAGRAGGAPSRVGDLNAIGQGGGAG